MIRALYSAASGMNAQQLNVDNIANNIANANTNGFKTRRAQFQDLLYQSMIQPGAAADQQSVIPTGLQLGLGTRPVSNEIIFTQGDFSQTNNPLDVVIQGSGFFQMRRSSGDLAYTKSGSFHLNATGQVVTANGDLLEPPITIPQGAQSGHHRHRWNGQLHASGTKRVAAGRPDPTRELRQSVAASTASATASFCRPTHPATRITGAPGGQEGMGPLLQGYVEQSNVSVVQEFVNLIVSQRAYEANSKVVKAADEMYQQVNNLKQ